MNKVEDRIKAVSDEFRDKIKTIALAAWGAISVLALNAAMMAYFEKYFSSENTPLAKLVYAILMILILTILTVKFSKKTSEQTIIVELNEKEQKVHAPLKLIIKLGDEEEKNEPKKPGEPKESGG